MRRRDRRGRGLRGPLLPHSLPAWRSRAQRFDDQVLDCLDRLPGRYAEQVAGIEFAVEDVPPQDPAPWEAREVPLSRVFPAERAVPARIVLYRRPLEARGESDGDLIEVVHAVVVEQVAQVLGLAPEDLDPGAGPAG